MTSERFAALAQECLEIVRRMAPIKTGNLRHNAIRLELTDPNTCVIYVDEDIAPYMPYTNEVWRHKIIRMGNFVPGEVVERMRTWNNPNEGWFDRAARTVALYIATQTGGILRDSN